MAGLGQMSSASASPPMNAVPILLLLLWSTQQLHNHPTLNCAIFTNEVQQI